MLRLATFESSDALVQVEGTFQAIDLRQNLIMAGGRDFFERRKTAPDRVKACIHILFDGVQADVHGSRSGAKKSWRTFRTSSTILIVRLLYSWPVSR